MSGRGRGRGRGAGNKALLDQLGLQKSDLIKEPSTGPPETFPSLQFRPVKTTGERSLDKAYMLVVKKELREHLHNSEYNIVLDTKKPDIERYSDRFHCLNNKSQLELFWPRYPKELRPKGKAPKGKKGETKRKLKGKVNVSNAKKRKATEVDVKGKLEELEKKETTGGEEDEEKKDEEKEEEEVMGDEVDEDVDEEMDEGTDYINSYFDNGEDYIEEDGDALEDGGVF